MMVRTVKAQDGESLTVPDDWALLPPGDAVLTRKVKKAGPTWTVEVKKGRKRFSHGVWALAKTIEDATAAMALLRETPAYQRKLERGREARRKKEHLYALEFEKTLVTFLDFAPCYEAIATELSQAISRHACPVGSGTVARTKRISIQERAEAALIAWMRHQSSNYDRMHVARVKGARREVRRKIAQQSRRLLDAYRRGDDIDLSVCVLYQALAKARDA
jgi:hypothetical protein